MQAMYTVYIVALNFILAGFSDAAVTVLGLYYKIQSFFFIPLFGLQTCIVPVLSYNYARANYARVRGVMRDSLIVSASFMLVGVLCFELIPRGLLSLFSHDEEVFAIGASAFRIIGASFFPAVLSLMLPVFFQAIGKALPSVMLSLTRQVFCLIPLFWGFSLIGLDYAWIAFPAAELITGRRARQDKRKQDGRAAPVLFHAGCKIGAQSLYFVLIFSARCAILFKMAWCGVPRRPYRNT